MYDFQQYKMIRGFGESIFTGKINIDEAEMDQSNLIENMVKFNNKSRSRSKEDKEKNRYLWECICSVSRLRINS